MAPRPQLSTRLFSCLMLWELLLVGCQPTEEQQRQQIAETIQSGRQLAQGGRSEEAIAAFTEVIRLDPNCAEAYAARADAREVLGELQAAVADSSQVVRLTPDDPEAYRRRAWLYLKLDDQERADADLAKARQLRLAVP